MSQCPNAKPPEMVALCPGHAGNMKREAAPKNLEGQEPLW